MFNFDCHSRSLKNFVLRSTVAQAKYELKAKLKTTEQKITTKKEQQQTNRNNKCPIYNLTASLYTRSWHPLCSALVMYV